MCINSLTVKIQEKMWVTGYLGIKVGDSECSWESATQWNSRGRTPLKRIPEYFIPTGSDFKVHLCLRQLNNLLGKKRRSCILPPEVSTHQLTFLCIGD